MPSTLELCEKYYGTRDIYKLMDLTKDSLEKDVKKAYYRLSLQVHPDRVSEDEKAEATEKFKVLTKINNVLTDPNKKAIYDEQGIIDDEGESESNWMQMWQQFFKPITVSDIERFKSEYIGSTTEERDIRKAYLGGKGCLNFMMNSVPFMTVEDEPRITEVVKNWIAAGEVPEYKLFTEEPKAKKNRRHKKYAKEALEAAAIKREIDAKNKAKTESLEQQLMKRQSEREASANNFFDHLLSKYGGADDSEEYVPGKKKSKNAVNVKKAANGKKAAPQTNGSKKQKVKSGRVTKKK